MILRRVTAHVRRQDWTAIAIDFVIVVIGVFIGIQVANWNQSRSDRARERLLLGELRAEIADELANVDRKRRGFAQITRSGRRALTFLESGVDCGSGCWPVVVDFFHASNWQPMEAGLPSYEELRRAGWPRNRGVVEAVDVHLRLARSIAATANERPEYRTLVRGLIPAAAHEPYWTTCWAVVDGAESYVEDCPPGVPPEVSAAAVAAVRAHPDIHRTLTQWVGFTYVLSATLEDLEDSGRRALALIDAELGTRP